MYAEDEAPVLGGTEYLVFSSLLKRTVNKIMFTTITSKEGSYMALM